jgi:hypothetical protein
MMRKDKNMVLVGLMIVTIISGILAVVSIANAQTTPTGCPYADGIPADSPKCAPPQEQQTPVLQPRTPEPLPSIVAPNPPNYSYGGK